MVNLRECMSPENGIPWILSGICHEKDRYGVSAVSSMGRSCGFCKSPYLKRIQEEIQQHSGKCPHELVVYGAALGADYVDFIRKAPPKSIDETVCSFDFVLESEIDASIPSREGNHIFIKVDASRLPYKSMRRNSRIFKMNPLELFPWAERVIWRDAKLLPKEALPNNFTKYFDDTVQHHGTCASFVSLPVHDSSMGLLFDTLSHASYKAHCERLVNAVSARPDVTDSVKALQFECALNMKYVGTEFLDRALIDGALLVWDLRTPRCRKIVGDLTCSWFDEYHCNTDRDQVSFGRAVHSIGARATKQTSMGDLVFWNDREPMIHFVRKFQNLRIAVMIAGSSQRFMFSSTLQHLLYPLVKQRHQPDLFLALTTEDAVESGEVAGIHVPDPQFVGKTGKDLELFIAEKVKEAGATARAILIASQVDVGEDPLWQQRQKEIKALFPYHSPEQYFPVPQDYHNGTVGPGNGDANIDLMRRMLGRQNLWAKVVEHEQAVGAKYDHVIFLRDDAEWLRDFYLNRLMWHQGDAFYLSCGGIEIHDDVIVARREVAASFGNYFSYFFEVDMQRCAREQKSNCDTDAIFKSFVKSKNIAIAERGQDWIPIQRSARILGPTGLVELCYLEDCLPPTIVGSKHTNTMLCTAVVNKTTG